jgi:hypothetical protein
VTTVATFSKPEEAHLLRTRLEAAGIPAFVQDEHIVQMDWLYSNAIGGVRVQIADEDVPAAQEFLTTDREQKPADAVDVLCPACGSPDTKPDERPRRLAFLSMLLFSFPLLLSRHRWRCNSCGQTFRAGPT